MAARVENGIALKAIVRGLWEFNSPAIHQRFPEVNDKTFINLYPISTEDLRNEME